MPRVAFIRGNDRRENVKRALDLLAGEIERELRSRQPLIKPNLVSSSVPLAVSHVDQVRGILDVISMLYAGRILIAEASCHDTFAAYRNYGYAALSDEYNVELADLNGEAHQEIIVSDAGGTMRTLRIARRLMDTKYYRISAAKIKTHDTVVVSLSIKNLAMAAVHMDDRKAVHCGYGTANRNIAEIAERVRPDLAVIDGMVGMEGNGPVRGEPVSLGVAFAGTDALAVDRMACDFIGVDVHAVGYLHYCAEKGLGTVVRDQIEMVGERFVPRATPLKLHRDVLAQYAWQQGTGDGGKGR
jgi:uncharacterized protein (DUF362 family)